MKELPPFGHEARAAIAEEVQAPGADASARKRLREKLWTALAIAPIVPLLPPATGAAIHSATVGAGHSVLTTSGRLLALVARYPGPVVAASLTMGGLGGVALHAELGHTLAQRHASSTHVARAVAPVVAPIPPTPIPLLPPPETPPAVMAPSEVPHPPASVHAIPAHAASRSTAVPAPAPAPAAATVPTLQEDGDLSTEAALLDRARTALARGWIDPALLALDQHRTRFPDGQLLEEREALKVIALARAGRTEEAQRLAAAFQTQFPESLWREQMETVLPSRP